MDECPPLAVGATRGHRVGDQIMQKGPTIRGLRYANFQIELEKVLKMRERQKKRRKWGTLPSERLFL